MEKMETAEKNLARGRAIATGIGVFPAVFKEGKILLRQRVEKGSIINKDLSGKWELPGGGVDLDDFSYNTPKYKGVVIRTIDRELREEVCLRCNHQDITMIPAWIKNDTLIDLAFVIPTDYEDTFPCNGGEYFDTFEEGLEKGLIGFFSEEEALALNIVSERIRFMITEAFRYHK
jgi:8-oxo-dGTP pyrophosphatase MutT (NUDIX family)